MRQPTTAPNTTTATTVQFVACESGNYTVLLDNQPVPGATDQAFIQVAAVVQRLYMNYQISMDQFDELVYQSEKLRGRPWYDR